ncbi:MFS transporter [Streptomyces decoyicus]|uniref:MFS transporter n=1 Tax=Streptomyces decoyicus TaxID=249567 RepID=UPI00365DFE36
MAFLVSLALVVLGIAVRLKVDETPAFQQIERRRAASRIPLAQLLRDPGTRRHTLLGMAARWGEGAAFNTWGVFAITYAASTLKLPRTSVLLAVTFAALLMAVLIPLSGSLVDRQGARGTYTTGIALFGLAVFPAFLLFRSTGIWGFAVTLAVTLGVVHAYFYGAQGTLFAALFPPEVRYTGMSVVYQLSGVFASGITPLLMTTFLALGHGTPWIACGYLATTAAVSVWATSRIRPSDMYFATGSASPQTHTADLSSRTGPGVRGPVTLPHRCSSARDFALDPGRGRGRSHRPRRRQRRSARSRHRTCLQRYVPHVTSMNIG